MPLNIPAPIDLLQGNEKLFRYSALADGGGNEGESIVLPGKTDVTVQLVSISGGATPTVVIEGSLQDSEADFVLLHDPQGGDLTFTGAALEAVLENVVRIRPRVSVGTTVVAEVLILLVGQGG